MAGSQQGPMQAYPSSSAPRRHETPRSAAEPSRVSEELAAWPARGLQEGGRGGVEGLGHVGIGLQAIDQSPRPDRRGRCSHPIAVPPPE